jgi:hypothetical protein
MTTTDIRWSLLEKARTRLLAVLADDGVTRIEFAVGFTDFQPISVWLCTTTDSELNAFLSPNPRIDVVRAEMAKVGFTGSDLKNLQTTAQSQESVDRSYDGSWFYAMR